MRLASRLATTGVVAAFAVGGLLTPPAHATPDRAATAQQTVTTQSSGTQWCTNGIADCRQKRNYRLYLGCWASHIRGTWYPDWYVFDWRC
ncbi:hypothetical protein [Jiangella ureilytica]|uniref:hypothetical protein n=1 Tax=Jiangella ureilytica TaxID=2530374 RepID=UPI001EF0F5B9|nr:hypothetical protein [Jiangella ureilytica]